MASMAPPVAREALHWSAVIDLILEGVWPVQWTS